MKKILSIILAAAIMLSLIPSVFATGEATEQELVISQIIAKTTGSSASESVEITDSVLSWTGIQVRRYSAGGNSSHRQFVALKASVATPGIYNVYFKTDNPEATSIAPAIAIAKYNSAMDSATNTNAIIGTDDKLLGYFNFSAAPAGEYAPVTKNGSADGEKIVADLEVGEYCILFAATLNSVTLNSKVINVVDGSVATDATGVNDSLNAAYQQEMYLSGIKLVPVEEDEELVAAFELDGSVPEENYNEPAVITISKDGSEIKSVKNADGTHNITAPEINKNGAKFLYWAKGLTTQKRILIGETNELKNYAPDSKYANYLIPVYADEVSGTEYYNANGQLIPGANQETRVSMAGYGTSTGWDRYGETNIYVAHYDLDEPEKNIGITVTGGTGTGLYAYGDTVICTANATGVFKCWTKTGINGETEIVSCDSTYSFKAWEECTVTAEYEDHYYTGSKMKIIIDAFDVAAGVTGVMAEFIGLEDAVEKGIMFTDSESNTTRIAMTKPGTQFSVIADEKGTYVGYAILRNESAYTLITDGEYEKNN